MAEGLKLANDIWANIEENHPSIAKLEGTYPGILITIILLTTPGSEFYKRLEEFVEERR